MKVKHPFCVNCGAENYLSNESDNRKMVICSTCGIIFTYVEKQPITLEVKFYPDYPITLTKQIRDQLKQYAGLYEAKQISDLIIAVVKGEKKTVSVNYKCDNWDEYQKIS